MTFHQHWKSNSSTKLNSCSRDFLAHFRNVLWSLERNSYVESNRLHVKIWQTQQLQNNCAYISFACLPLRQRLQWFSGQSFDRIWAALHQRSHQHWITWYNRSATMGVRLSTSECACAIPCNDKGVSNTRGHPVGSPHLEGTEKVGDWIWLWTWCDITGVDNDAKNTSATLVMFSTSRVHQHDCVTKVQKAILRHW